MRFGTSVDGNFRSISNTVLKREFVKSWISPYEQSYNKSGLCLFNDLTVTLEGHNNLRVTVKS